MRALPKKVLLVAHCREVGGSAVGAGVMRVSICRIPRARPLRRASLATSPTLRQWRLGVVWLCKESS
jgi:hypothetical protein